MRILCDVDGVVADLMGGFCGYLLFKGDKDLPPISKSQIDHHRLGKSKGLGELGREYYREFLNFMSDDPYRWTPPMRDSLSVIRSLAKDHDFLFVTATMSSIPSSYKSKAEWLVEQGLGAVPVCSIPSEEKHYFHGDVAIDDRLDICLNYGRRGITPILFYQPWSVSGESILDLEGGVVCEPGDTQTVEGLVDMPTVTNKDLSAWRSIESLIVGGLADPPARW